MRENIYLGTVFLNLSVREHVIFEKYYGEARKKDKNYKIKYFGFHPFQIFMGICYVFL